MMVWAYEFLCKESSTDRLCARLNSLRGWNWTLGDSHWYGDYVKCVPVEGVRIRIVDFPKRVNDQYKYDADVRLADGCKKSMKEIDQAFRAVLEQIGAHGVREIETFD
jgi:hypothetical protein